MHEFFSLLNVVLPPLVSTVTSAAVRTFIYFIICFWERTGLSVTHISLTDITYATFDSPRSPVEEGMGGLKGLNSPPGCWHITPVKGGDPSVKIKVCIKNLIESDNSGGKEDEEQERDMHKRG